MQRSLLIKKIEVVEEQQRRIKQNRFFHFKPYDWQFTFFKAGLTYRQRMLMAANKVGKTLVGCFELACHLTGIYPDWWPGIRFNFPINAWALGVSGEQIRDTLQNELVGKLTDEGFTGGGILPVVLVRDIVRSMTPRVAKDIAVEHLTGGSSTLSFKSYGQGQHVLMGPKVDYSLVDEEPLDPTIWGQLLTRSLYGNRGKGGSLVATMTPENGETQLVDKFYNNKSIGQYFQGATWDDAPHLDQQVKKEILASYPPHERDMRSKGIPLMGAGAVFQIEDSVFSEPALEKIPKYWPRIIGLDIGWDHPTALVWIAYDRDNDVMHLYDIWRQSEVMPTEVVGVIRPRQDAWAPVAWPHDGLQHDKGSGKQIAELYRQQGAVMLSEHATFEDGSNGVEAGIFAMSERMKSGRLRVASHLSPWFEEKRHYHRKRNKKAIDATPVIVKLKDDLLCATRYAMMMLRYAATEPIQHYEEPDVIKETWY